MHKRAPILQLVFIAFSVIGGMLAPEVSVKVLMSISTSMVGLAGVVVTVFGIWVAIIFPRMLSGIESGSADDASKDKDRYHNLIKSLYRSCLVLCANLFVFITSSIYGSDIKSQFFSSAVVTFLWLSFFSIISSLWGAVFHGELTAVSAINVSEGKGLLKRLRRRGKTSSRRADD